jgi:hypothetical protein
MITIDTYTGTWQEALRPSAPDVGTEVRIPDSHHPDGRERDDFRRVLDEAGLDIQWDRADDDDGEWSIWTVAAKARGES